MELCSLNVIERRFSRIAREWSQIKWNNLDIQATYPRKSAHSLPLTILDEARAAPTSAKSLFMLLRKVGAAFSAKGGSASGGDLRTSALKFL